MERVFRLARIPAKASTAPTVDVSILTESGLPLLSEVGGVAQDALRVE